jgi:hypothetical protein
MDCALDLVFICAMDNGTAAGIVVAVVAAGIVVAAAAVAAVVAAGIVVAAAAVAAVAGIAAAASILFCKRVYTMLIEVVWQVCKCVTIDDSAITHSILFPHIV